MQSDSRSPSGPLVIMRAEAPGQITAQLVGLPEVQATAATREDALRGVQKVLDQWLAAGRLIPLTRPEENPWRKHAGWAANDPEYGQFLEELTRQRQQLENETQG